MTSLVEEYSPSATAWRMEFAIGAGKATLNRSISAIAPSCKTIPQPAGVSKVLSVKQRARHADQKPERVGATTMSRMQIEGGSFQQ
jgi:hypothetical protein